MLVVSTMGGTTTWGTSLSNVDVLSWDSSILLRGTTTTSSTTTCLLLLATTVSFPNSNKHLEPSENLIFFKGGSLPQFGVLLYSFQKIESSSLIRGGGPS